MIKINNRVVWSCEPGRRGAVVDTAGAAGRAKSTEQQETT